MTHLCHPMMRRVVIPEIFYPGSRITSRKGVRVEKQYFVYILSNRKNGVLYVGVTSNLARRTEEHCLSVVDGFAEKYRLRKLVYYECYRDINEAIVREKRLKEWKRDWKIQLIERTNPEWRDLKTEM